MDREVISELKAIERELHNIHDPHLDPEDNIKRLKGRLIALFENDTIIKEGYQPVISKIINTYLPKAEEALKKDRQEYFISSILQAKRDLNRLLNELEKKYPEKTELKP